MAKIREVRKRDSRIVPFDESKIADAIYAAFRSVGEGDRALATELASAVTHFLEEKFSGSIPGIEDIQDLVETVLIEMGHTRIAKEYIKYRQKRAMLRETLQVRKVTGHEGEGVSYDYGAVESAVCPAGEEPFPEVDLGERGVSRWHKSRIAAALIREADLDPSVAEEIASNVERKVLDSGLKRISTSLIRELVDNELFELGFSAKLQKQAPLGLPKYNLEQLIFGTDSKEGYTFPKTPPEIRNIIANRILHQYSLEEVFTPSVADAHREGRIFIHRLSDPIRLSRLLWHLPAPGAVRSAGDGLEVSSRDAAPGSYLDLRDFFRKLWHLAHFFSEEIRLTGLSNLLLDPASRALSAVEKVRAVLDRLAQMEERPGIALEFDLTPEVLPWIEGLLAHGPTHPGRFLVAFRLRKEILDPAGGDAVLDAVAKLYERGERVEFLPRNPPGAAEVEQPGGEERGVVHGRSLPLLIACGAKISVNLPRAGFRSARDRGRSVETEVEEVLDLAIKAHLERRRYMERLGANRESPLWNLTGKAAGAPLLDLRDITFSVGVVGLNECVKFLSGSDLHSGSLEDGRLAGAASKLGVDIVRDIDRKLRREERSLGIRLHLEETANVGPLRMLERMDRSKYPQMVTEIERGRQPQWGPLYTDGARLHRMAPVDPLRRVEELAAYLRYLAPSGGVIEDFPELRSSAKELLLSLLEECLPIVAA